MLNFVSLSSLGCYVWGLNNCTQSLGDGVKDYFVQPFRPDITVFRNVELSLNAKDSIVLLLLLLCLLCTSCNMLRNKTLHGVVQHLLEVEEKRSKATASMSAQNVTEDKGTKCKAPASVSMQTETEGKGTKSALSISAQTITKPQQPRSVLVAPIQKKKSNNKQVQQTRLMGMRQDLAPSGRDRARNHHSLSIPG